MARVIEYQNFVTLLVLLNFVFITTARPLIVLKTVNCPDASDGLFDLFSLGSIKEGPSPGIGHGFENKAPFGGIKFGVDSGIEHGYQPSGNKDGSSHQHEFASIETLGGIKDGPSPGIGHKIVESLGGRKDSSPSPGVGH